jgi:hypothetical protein
MANLLYPKYKEVLLQAGINLSSGSVKALLVDAADYTYSATHQFLSDVTAIGRVATSGALGSKTFVSGVFDSADPTFSAVSGDQSEIIILFVDTGVAGTSPLIAYYDTGITGIPVTPSGGDINVIVNASGWFAL